MRKILEVLGLLLAVAALIVLLPRLATGMYGALRTRSPEKIAPRPAAIVFGAGLWRDGSPTPVLRDRVQVAANLYFSGKVERLLMSGTTIGYYNETRAMRNYAMELGIPNEAIIQDYGGWRTYDTCYRARYTFGVQQAILVTQSFHLPRALFTCNALGVKSDGVRADLSHYRKSAKLWWNLRELPATLVALWEVYIQPPVIKLGEPQPIRQTQSYNEEKHRDAEHKEF
jgi:SanA protein